MDSNYQLLIACATTEADNLKKHANPEELNRLDFSSFNPSLVDRCIYGQMTGNCFSSRAKQLIRMCTLKMYTDNQSAIQLDGNEMVEGEYAGNWSPIELLVGENKVRGNYQLTKDLIDYLQGKKETFGELDN